MFTTSLLQGLTILKKVSHKKNLHTTQTLSEKKLGFSFKGTH